MFCCHSLVQQGSQGSRLLKWQEGPTILSFILIIITNTTFRPSSETWSSQAVSFSQPIHSEYQAQVSSSRSVLPCATPSLYTAHTSKTFNSTSATLGSSCQYSCACSSLYFSKTRVISFAIKSYVSSPSASTCLSLVSFMSPFSSCFLFLLPF